MPLAGFSKKDQPDKWYKNFHVSFELPRNAAKRLHDLAVSGDKRLKEVGVLKVQIRDLRDISTESRGEFSRPQLASLSNGGGGSRSQKNQGLQRLPLQSGAKSAAKVPWQPPQDISCPSQFTYYSSTQPKQPQLVRERADVRLYTMPTSDKGEYRTKIIGISRGVLTEESIPIDSHLQESVPSWLIESSLCISFRRHGKCDVACQTGSERIMYRPRPGSFQYDTTVRPPPLRAELKDNSGRSKNHNTKGAPIFQPQLDKSPTSQVPNRKQCSSESILILESLANSLVASDEKAGEGLSGDYPFSKKSHLDANRMLLDNAFSHKKLSGSPNQALNQSKQLYQPYHSNQVLQSSASKREASYSEGRPQECLSKQPISVPKADTMPTRRFSADYVQTVNEGVKGSQGRRKSGDIPSVETELRIGEVSLAHSYLQGENNRREREGKLVDGKARGQGENLVGVIPANVNDSGENSRTNLACEAADEKRQVIIGPPVEDKKGLGQEVAKASQDVMRKVLQPIETRKANFSPIDENQLKKTEIKTESLMIEDGGSLSTDQRELPSVIPRTKFGFTGESLPISVSLGSDYLRGITARGSDGKFRKSVVSSGETKGPQPTVSLGINSVTTQTTTTGLKRKRGRPPKVESGLTPYITIEQAKRKRGRPPKQKIVKEGDSDAEKMFGADSKSQTVDSTGHKSDQKENILKGNTEMWSESKADEKVDVIKGERSGGVIGERSEGVGGEKLEADWLYQKNEECIRHKLSLPVDNVTGGSDKEIVQKRLHATVEQSITDTGKTKMKVDPPYSQNVKRKAADEVTAEVQKIATDSQVTGKAVAVARKIGSGCPVPKVASASMGLPYRWASTSRPASPCDNDKKIRSRSHRWFQKDSIHRDIEEAYHRMYPSVACETEQLLPDDIYYGENYPIVFADDDDIDMKFVDMSTAFKLAMREKQTTNYSTRDERRGVAPLKPVLKPKTQRDVSLYDKMQRKRASVESRVARQHPTSKRRSVDYNSDVEFVADRSLRRSTEEEDLMKPIHRMSLRPRRAKTLDEYLSSDSLEDDDTEPDTGSMYESDDSSDSEPLINKVKGGGKPYLLNSKRHLRKSPAGSDEDGERKTTRSSSLSGTSEVRCELQRSESVSTNESDTFDVIPCRRRSPAESSTKLATVKDDLAMLEGAPVSMKENLQVVEGLNQLAAKSPGVHRSSMQDMKCDGRIGDTHDQDVSGNCATVVKAGIDLGYVDNGILVVGKEADENTGKEVELTFYKERSFEEGRYGGSKFEDADKSDAERAWERKVCTEETERGSGIEKGACEVKDGDAIPAHSMTVAKSVHVSSEETQVVSGSEHVIPARATTVAKSVHVSSEETQVVSGSEHVIPARATTVAKSVHVSSEETQVVSGSEHVIPACATTVAKSVHVSSEETQVVSGSEHVIPAHATTVTKGEHVSSESKHVKMESCHSVHESVRMISEDVHFSACNEHVIAHEVPETKPSLSGDEHVKADCEHVVSENVNVLPEPQKPGTAVEVPKDHHETLENAQVESGGALVLSDGEENVSGIQERRTGISKRVKSTEKDPKCAQMISGDLDRNNELKRDLGSGDDVLDATSSQESREEGSRITRLIKKSIKKISDTIGRKKERKRPGEDKPWLEGRREARVQWTDGGMVAAKNEKVVEQGDVGIRVASSMKIIDNESIPVAADVPALCALEEEAREGRDESACGRVKEFGETLIEKEAEKEEDMAKDGNERAEERVEEASVAISSVIQSQRSNETDLSLSTSNCSDKGVAASSIEISCKAGKEEETEGVRESKYEKEASHANESKALDGKEVGNVGNARTDGEIKVTSCEHVSEATVEAVLHNVGQCKRDGAPQDSIRGSIVLTPSNVYIEESFPRTDLDISYVNDPVQPLVLADGSSSFADKETCERTALQRHNVSKDVSECTNNTGIERSHSLQAIDQSKSKTSCLYETKSCDENDKGDVNVDSSRANDDQIINKSLGFVEDRASDPDESTVVTAQEDSSEHEPVLRNIFDSFAIEYRSFAPGGKNLCSNDTDGRCVGKASADVKRKETVDSEGTCGEISREDAATNRIYHLSQDSCKVASSETGRRDERLRGDSVIKCNNNSNQKEDRDGTSGNICERMCKEDANPGNDSSEDSSSRGAESIVERIRKATVPHSSAAEETERKSTLCVGNDDKMRQTASVSAMDGFIGGDKESHLEGSFGKVEVEVKVEAEGKKETNENTSAMKENPQTSDRGKMLDGVCNQKVVDGNQAVELNLPVQSERRAAEEGKESVLFDEKQANLGGKVELSFGSNDKGLMESDSNCDEMEETVDEEKEEFRESKAEKRVFCDTGRWDGNSVEGSAGGSELSKVELRHDDDSKAINESTEQLESINAVQKSKKEEVISKGHDEANVELCKDREPEASEKSNDGTDVEKIKVSYAEKGEEQAEACDEDEPGVVDESPTKKVELESIAIADRSGKESLDSISDEKQVKGDYIVKEKDLRTENRDGVISAGVSPSRSSGEADRKGVIAGQEEFPSSVVSELVPGNISGSSQHQDESFKEGAFDYVIKQVAAVENPPRVTGRVKRSYLGDVEEIETGESRSKVCKLDLLMHAKEEDSSDEVKIFVEKEIASSTDCKKVKGEVQGRGSSAIDCGNANLAEDPDWLSSQVSDHDSTTSQAKLIESGRTESGTLIDIAGGDHHYNSQKPESKKETRAIVDQKTSVNNLKIKEENISCNEKSENKTNFSKSKKVEEVDSRDHEKSIERRESTETCSREELRKPTGTADSKGFVSDQIGTEMKSDTEKVPADINVASKKSGETAGPKSRVSDVLDQESSRIASDFEKVGTDVNPVVRESSETACTSSLGDAVSDQDDFVVVSDIQGGGRDSWQVNRDSAEEETTEILANTDALKSLRLYQESSDEEFLMSTDIECPADCEKGVERFEQTSEKPRVASLSEGEGGEPNTTSKPGSKAIGRKRRNSTTEHEARLKHDGARKGRSPAESDLLDANLVVLTRSMRRQTGSPAKRLRSSKP